MSLESAQLTLHVTIRIDPSNIDPFLKALRPCYEGCLNEPECLFFDVFHDPETPGTFRFVEVWTKDRAWFEKYQLTKEYYGPYEETTKPMWITPRDLLYTERVAGWSAVGEEYLKGARRI